MVVALASGIDVGRANDMRSKNRNFVIVISYFYLVQLCNIYKSQHNHDSVHHCMIIRIF